TVLTEMLVALDVDREIAVEDACKIEHVISDASFYAIKQHMHKYKQ
ncbi:MAG: metal-dependent transcriptional regulator, partial [Clostridia bacterium]|nr:metal-dependent transcriptional regulator [Clostridia bacterium]